MRQATLHVMTFFADGVQIASHVPGALEAIVARGKDIGEATRNFKRAKHIYRFAEAPWSGWTWLDKPHTRMTP